MATTSIAQGNLRDLPNAAAEFDGIMRDALRSLCKELAGAQWLKREQQIVNLFTLGHLLRLFEKKELDPALLDIEGRVAQVRDIHCLNSKPLKRNPWRARKDLVIWSRRLDGYWRNEKAAAEWERSGIHRLARDWRGDRPFAVIEWKFNGDENPNRVERLFRRDIGWLKANSGVMQLGYAVFVDWSSKVLKVKCIRIQDSREQEFFTHPASAARGAS